MRFLIIDHLISSDFWTVVDSTLREIFMMIPGKAFAGLSVLTLADFFSTTTSSQRKTYIFVIF